MLRHTVVINKFSYGWSIWTQGRPVASISCWQQQCHGAWRTPWWRLRPHSSTGNSCQIYLSWRVGFLVSQIWQLFCVAIFTWPFFPNHSYHNRNNNKKSSNWGNRDGNNHQYCIATAFVTCGAWSTSVCPCARRRSWYRWVRTNCKTDTICSTLVSQSEAKHKKEIIHSFLNSQARWFNSEKV